jgi:hypothetical protein
VKYPLMGGRMGGAAQDPGGLQERLAGYGILAVLGLITVWLLIQQSQFNPAVTVALRGGEVQGRIQSAAGSSLAATAALIPEVPGFTPRGSAQSFGPENLSDKINGKAELYLAAGFKEMSARSFTLDEAGQAHLEILVYDMGSPDNAYAVFSAQRRPGSPDIPLTAHAYATPNALFFTRGPFYVEMVADRAEAAIQGSLKEYAAALVAKMPSEGEVATPAGLFPPEGLTADSVRLSAADTFGLEGFNQVYTGEYALQRRDGHGLSGPQGLSGSGRGRGPALPGFFDRQRLPKNPKTRRF